MDISSLPEKVFRVLVDPIGKGYTVDETDVDFNLFAAGKHNFSKPPFSDAWEYVVGE